MSETEAIVVGVISLATIVLWGELRRPRKPRRKTRLTKLSKTKTPLIDDTPKKNKRLK